MKLSWLAPNPAMMMASTPTAVYQIIAENGAFTLRAMPKGTPAFTDIGVYASKAEAKAAAASHDVKVAAD